MTKTRIFETNRNTEEERTEEKGRESRKMGKAMRWPENDERKQLIKADRSLLGTDTA